ncbi:MAG: dCMP deaminase family protein [Deltaproteobacteria bacterium]|nr:dCMP deaminase family protein [Deltaproteobacteria bacterium]
MPRPSWDDNFLAISHVVAKRSKDTSTQLGAVIVGPDHEIRSTGYNCFPRGIDDDVEARYERPEKYKWIEHAERNAIYNAARMGTPLKGCTVFVPWIPCTDCARAIIQVGMVEVVVEDIQVPDRWREDFHRSLTMLEEAGVCVRHVNCPEPLHPADVLRRDVAP